MTLPATCQSCQDTGWEMVTGVQTIKGHKAATAVRRCPNGCAIPRAEGVRVVYDTPAAPVREVPTESVSFE